MRCLNASFPAERAEACAAAGCWLAGAGGRAGCAAAAPGPAGHGRFLHAAAARAVGTLDWAQPKTVPSCSISSDPGQPAPPGLPSAPAYGPEINTQPASPHCPIPPRRTRPCQRMMGRPEHSSPPPLRFRSLRPTAAPWSAWPMLVVLWAVLQAIPLAVLPAAAMPSPPCRRAPAPARPRPCSERGRRHQRQHMPPWSCACCFFVC